jgi:hypothetical protein
MTPIFLFLILYIPFTIYHITTIPATGFQEPSNYAGCDEFTKKFEGGWREFNGQKYKLQMCAKLVLEKRGFFGWGPPLTSERIRLAVFNQDGNLQALGYFTGSNNSFYFQIEEDSIKFGDWEGSSNGRAIKMPPSKLEWIRARLPSIKDDLLDR